MRIKQFLVCISFIQNCLCLTPGAKEKIIFKLWGDEKQLIRQIQNSTHVANSLRFGIAVCPLIACCFANLIFCEQFLSAFVKIISNFVKYYSCYHLSKDLSDKASIEKLFSICTNKYFNSSSNNLLSILQQNFRNECISDSSLIANSLASIFSALIDKNIFIVASFYFAIIILAPFLIGSLFAYLEELCVSGLEYLLIQDRGNFEDEDSPNLDVAPCDNYDSYYSNYLLAIIEKAFPYLFGCLKFFKEILDGIIFINYRIFSFAILPIKGAKNLLLPSLGESFYNIINQDIADISFTRILSKTTDFHTQISGYYSFNAFEKLPKDIVTLLKKCLLPQIQEICKIFIAIGGQFYFLNKLEISNPEANIMLSMCCLVWMWILYYEKSEDVREAEHDVNQAKSQMYNDCSEVLQNINAIYPELEIKRRKDMQNLIFYRRTQLEDATNLLRANLFKIKLLCCTLSGLLVLFQQRELLMKITRYIFNFIEFKNSISLKRGIFESFDAQIIEEKTSVIALAEKIHEQVNRILQADRPARANISNFLKEKIGFDEDQIQSIPWGVETSMDNLCMFTSHLNKLLADYKTNSGKMYEYLDLLKSNTECLKGLANMLENHKELLFKIYTAYKKNDKKVDLTIDEAIRKIPDTMMIGEARDRLSKPMANIYKSLSLVSRIGSILYYCFQSMEAAAQLFKLNIEEQQISNAIRGSLSIITCPEENDDSGVPFYYNGGKAEIKIGKPFRYRHIEKPTVSSYHLSIEEVRESIIEALKIKQKFATPA